MEVQFLTRCLQSHPATAPYFLGVIDAQQLSHFHGRTTPYCFVINISAPDLFGHFVCFYRNANLCYFVDSYGKPPSFYSLNCHFPHVIVNDKQFQCSHSCTCALFCAYFLVGLCRGRPLHDLISKLRTVDRKSNDILLLRWFVAEFSVHFSARDRKRLLTCNGHT